MLGAWNRRAPSAAICSARIGRHLRHGPLGDTLLRDPEATEAPVDPGLTHRPLLDFLLVQLIVMTASARLGGRAARHFGQPRAVEDCLRHRDWRHPHEWPLPAAGAAGGHGFVVDARAPCGARAGAGGVPDSSSSTSPISAIGTTAARPSSSRRWASSCPSRPGLGLGLLSSGSRWPGRPIAWPMRCS